MTSPARAKVVADRPPATCSILIPAYNVAEFIEEAIESALQQTAVNTEVIVVDDGSTDGTPARIAQYAGDVVIVSQSNRGLSSARNAGIAAASGDIIGLLDGDDRWHRDRVERCVSYLLEHPECGFVTSDAEIIDEAGRPTGELFFQGDRVFPTERFAENIVARNFMFGAALIRRDALEDIGGFDETLRTGCEDYDIWLRLIASGWNPGIVREPLAQYRIRSGSLSGSGASIAAAHRLVLERNLPDFWKLGVYGPGSHAWSIGTDLLQRGERLRAAAFFLAATRAPGKTISSRVKTAVKASAVLVDDIATSSWSKLLRRRT